MSHVVAHVGSPRSKTGVSHWLALGSHRHIVRDGTTFAGWVIEVGLGACPQSVAGASGDQSEHSQLGSLFQTSKILNC